MRLRFGFTADVSVALASRSRVWNEVPIAIVLSNHRRTGQGGREGSRPLGPLGFGKLVKFGQMGWEIRAFRGLNFSR